MRTALRTHPLGATGLEISRVGFGAWAVGGGGWQFGWGPQDDDESIGAIHRALELGVNWIDTAAVYGFGRSESVVGRALRGLPERPYVFTKCSRVDDGTRHVKSSLKRDSVLREAEQSLDRLGIDVIDLYQVHWPLPDEDIEEGWTAMGSGLLTGSMTRERIAAMPADDWRQRDRRFTEPLLSENLALVDRLLAVAARHDTAAGAVAIAWALRNPAVSGAIVGFRRPAQVDPIVGAAGLDLTSEDVAEIEAAT